MVARAPRRQPVTMQSMRFLSLFAARFASVRTDRLALFTFCSIGAPRETLIGRTRWRRTSLRALSITGLNGSLKYIFSI